MIIDCDDCALRDLACGDCVVTAMLGPADDVDDQGWQALDALADGGLVPRLRLVPLGLPELPGENGPPARAEAS